MCACTCVCFGVEEGRKIPQGSAALGIESIQIFLSMDSKADVPKALCLQSNQFVQ